MFGGQDKGARYCVTRDPGDTVGMKSEFFGSTDDLMAIIAATSNCAVRALCNDGTPEKTAIAAVSQHFMAGIEAYLGEKHGTEAKQ